MEHSNLDLLMSRLFWLLGFFYQYMLSLLRDGCGGVKISLKSLTSGNGISAFMVQWQQDLWHLVHKSYALPVMPQQANENDEIHKFHDNNNNICLILHHLLFFTTNNSKMCITCIK